jgi:hypothetical protein
MLRALNPDFPAEKSWFWMRIKICVENRYIGFVIESLYAPVIMTAMEIKD